MQNKIAILLPVRNFGTKRYERLIRCLDSYYQMTEKLSDVFVLYDDDEEDIYKPILEKYDWVKSICIPSGITLVEKINIPAPDLAKEYRYIGFIGDDIVFKTRWESEFINFLSKQKYGLAYANDLLHTTGELATHPFLTSNLVTILGFFGCPAVGHHFLDDYWMQVFKKVGEKRFFPHIIMEHMHPAAQKEQEDELYVKIESKFDENREKFREYLSDLFIDDILKLRNHE
jgi:hypothetical protein